MSENRRLTRRNDAFRMGTLQAAGSGDAIACLVWDLSPAGACIEVARQDTVDTFLLTISDSSDPRYCTVVRREGRMLGVRFE